MKLYGTLATAAIMISYIPQLIQTYTTKDVRGQNLKFWVLLTFSVSYFLLDALMGNNIVTIISQLVNFTGAALMLVAVIRFREDK